MTTSICSGRGYIRDANHGLAPSQPDLKASAGTARGLLIVTPAGLENYFAALHAAATGPASPQVRTVMAQYGIRPALVREATCACSTPTAPLGSFASWMPRCAERNGS